MVKYHWAALIVDQRKINFEKCETLDQKKKRQPFLNGARLVDPIWLGDQLVFFVCLCCVRVS